MDLYDVFLPNVFIPAIGPICSTFRWLLSLMGSTNWELLLQTSLCVCSAWMVVCNVFDGGTQCPPSHTESTQRDGGE